MCIPSFFNTIADSHFLLLHTVCAFLHDCKSFSRRTRAACMLVLVQWITNIMINIILCQFQIGIFGTKHQFRAVKHFFIFNVAKTNNHCTLLLPCDADYSESCRAFSLRSSYARIYWLEQQYHLLCLYEYAQPI